MVLLVFSFFFYNLLLNLLLLVLFFFFFFKQKTAYEMRISDWSSDVCSSDLRRHAQRAGGAGSARLRPEGRDGDRAGKLGAGEEGPRRQAWPGADERRLLLDQFARRHWRHVVHADRQCAGSGDPRRVEVGDEARLERREDQAPADAAAVAVE